MGFSITWCAVPEESGGDDAGVDYLFEIPLRVAKSLVGFKHDEMCPHLIGGRFAVMASVASTPGVLSRIFGRK
jgi:hypothetical protein